MPTTVSSRRYQPMGVQLSVRSESPAMVVAIEAGLARYPNMGIDGAMSIDVTVHDDDDGDPAWPTVVTTGGSGDLLMRIGSSSATVHHPTAAAHIALAESLCAVPDALRLLAESVFTAVGVRAGRLHAVHSALVVRDGVGLVLRGPSGAGKSTLTYSGLRAGMGVCSDDWIYANARRPAGVFAGYPWRMLMTQEAAARFVELASVDTVPHPAAEGCKVPVHPPAGRQVVVAAAAAVVLLDPHPVLALRAVDVREATARFWASALPTERRHLTGEWVTQLLDRPVFVLQRGTDPEAAVQCLADLADSLR